MIKKIDHVVITAKDALATIEFYKKLGFTTKDESGRFELYAGDFKINVHVLGKEFLPHARNVQTGSADFCFEITGSIEEFKNTLENKGIEIELGVVLRNGTRGEMKSIYLRDPDENLIEFSVYIS